MKLVLNMGSALQLISQGLLKINNKPIRTPNYICTPRDVLTVVTKVGVRQIKLAEYFGVTNFRSSRTSTISSPSKKTRNF